MANHSIAQLSFLEMVFSAAEQEEQWFDFAALIRKALGFSEKHWINSLRVLL